MYKPTSGQRDRTAASFRAKVRKLDPFMRHDMNPKLRFDATIDASVVLNLGLLAAFLFTTFVFMFS